MVRFNRFAAVLILYHLSVGFMLDFAHGSPTVIQIQPLHGCEAITDLQKKRPNKKNLNFIWIFCYIILTLC